MKTTLDAFRPRGAVAWILTVVGVALLLGVCVTTYYMLRAIDYDGIGKLGVFGLMLAPQLGCVSLAALAFALFARIRRATIAVLAFGLVTLVTAVMALVPTISQRLYASRQDVSVSSASMLVPKIQGGGAGTSVTYAESPDGVPLVLDVWRARGVPEGRLRPAIVKIHGGGWNHGSRHELPEWNRFFNELGYDVFDIDYRLPPPARFRDEIGDVKCAIGWVAENAEKYGIDPARISLVGHSAGGNLALLAAYSMKNPMLPASCPVKDVAIRSVVNFYGPSDLKKLYKTTGSPEYSRPLMHAYLGGSLDDFINRYELVSPLRHVKARCPPTLTFQGEADRVVPPEQSKLLDEALMRAHVPRETYFIPWAEHGFDMIWGSFATQTARAKVKAFLLRYG